MPNHFKMPDLTEIILAETKDFGVGELLSIQAKKTVLKEAFDFSSLKGAFSKVPAIVVGAGPSLELDGKGLDPLLKKRALILSGGTALEWMDKKGIAPHFSLIFDPACEEQRFAKVKELGNPALFTLRANAKVMTGWKGKKWLLSTEALHLWETAWHPTKSEIDVGWNIATALGAFAEFLGCPSILFLGVDLHPGKRGEIYPKEIQTTARDLKRETRDLEWHLAREWLQNFAENMKDVDIFIGEHSPLEGFRKNSLERYLASYCRETFPIEEMIKEKEGEKISSFDDFEAKYKLSYKKMKEIFDAYLGAEEIELLYLQPFYQKILYPLWRIWAPKFMSACKARNIPWMDKPQELAFIKLVLDTYKRVFLG